MRRSSRHSSHNRHEEDCDQLLRNFHQLKEILNRSTDLTELESNVFLGPFLEVIRSEDTSGPITGLALSSLNKFLSYNLFDPYTLSTISAIDNIADAVTHARFVGTDPTSDEVILMKILHVLRTLMLCPAGVLLTNESVCEIMQSCFRICFEMRLSGCGVPGLSSWFATTFLKFVVDVMTSGLPQTCGFQPAAQSMLPVFNPAISGFQHSINLEHELLRKSAEHTLMDMIQLLFIRLPKFNEDAKWNYSMKKGLLRNCRLKSVTWQSSQIAQLSIVDKAGAGLVVFRYGERFHSWNALALKMRADGVDSSRLTKRRQSPKLRVKHSVQKQCPAESRLSVPHLSEAADEKLSNSASTESFEHVSCEHTAPSPDGLADVNYSFELPAPGDEAQDVGTGEEKCESILNKEIVKEMKAESGPSSMTRQALVDVPMESSMSATVSQTEFRPDCAVSSSQGPAVESTGSVDAQSSRNGEFVNDKGVRFLCHQKHTQHPKGHPLIPHGLPCVLELFRFLASLTNPLDRHNTDVMIHMGLSQLVVALETGSDHIGHYTSLLYFVKDELCRNLSTLLHCERLSLFTTSLRVSFLLFESMRCHLKFQLEMYLSRLSEVIVSESAKVPYDRKEIALEMVSQLWRIPGFVTELYINYDCDMYCSNIFEDYVKLLSKNAFPVSGLFTAHLLSLEALLTVVDSMELNCNLHHHPPSSSKAVCGVEQMSASNVPGHSESVLTNTDMSRDASSIAFSEQQAVSDDTADSTCTQKQTVETDVSSLLVKDAAYGRHVKQNCLAGATSRLPGKSELVDLRNKKKVYMQGTEYFNQKASKGITFLQQHSLLATPENPAEVVSFLRVNVRLDKRMIGEYIGAKKNKLVLEAFVKSFNLEDVRLDEALRLILETFRLPGEAPIISWIMDHFADHWHKSNSEPFLNNDAAFTLAYAIIMLNVDQHNHNVKKQNVPMNIDQFKNNVSKVNGGEDFDQEMLEDIFNSIHNEEIIVPDEHTGQLRENYIWKVLLNRGAAKDSQFIHVPIGAFDSDVFLLVWGPTVAALSFVFDKSSEESIIKKVIAGFQRCAMISAHNSFSDVFDNLVISLFKFTTLLSANESPEQTPILFGSNTKAQLAARVVFGLIHRHGDMLRGGWKNILECMVQLFRSKLLPLTLVEVEDFIDPSGKISIIRKESTVVARSESGVLSSFVSYFSLSESAAQKGPTAEELEATRKAQICVQDCQLESLIADSKFLHIDSLTDLVKALVAACQSAEEPGSVDGHYDEDAGIFFFELLVKVVLQNRDRVTAIWTAVHGCLCWVFVKCRQAGWLVERAVVGLLRMSIRLLRREAMAKQVLSALRLLFLLPASVLHSLSRQITFGLHELLRTNAANIHEADDWCTLFSLLEVAGAGAKPQPFSPPLFNCGVDASSVNAEAVSDSEVTDHGSISEAGSDRGYTSDSELYECHARHQNNHHHLSTPDLAIVPVSENGSWMLVNRREVHDCPFNSNQYSIELHEQLVRVDKHSLSKAAETLAFLVRDAAHITPHNFHTCVHAIRVFVEASVNGGIPHAVHRTASAREKRGVGHSHKSQHSRPWQQREVRVKKSQSSPSHLSQTCQVDEDGVGDPEVVLSGPHLLPIRLLDLMHTLHTRAASIFSAWAEENLAESSEDACHGVTERGIIDAATGTLWATCWCPLLQGIALLCCDSRLQVRSQAITYLQRALLVHDLQILSASQWEACFNKVLFPLLTKLLENINSHDTPGMEETRMRASTLLCKVFLQHLNQLLCLNTFTALWLTILEFMEKYMTADSSDLLEEAIPENIKNMLLVMETAGIFHSDAMMESKLWRLTWDKIDTFLPELKAEIFKPFHLDGKTSGGQGNDVRVGAAQPSSQRVPAATSCVLQMQHGVLSPEGNTANCRHKSASDVEVSLDGIQATVQYTKMRPVTTEPAPASVCVLHAPLTSVTASCSITPVAGDRVPLLLNPDILQCANIPFLSPQTADESDLTGTSDLFR